MDYVNSKKSLKDNPLTGNTNMQQVTPNNKKINLSKTSRIEAFVPRFKIERKGLIRGFSEDYDIQDLIDLSSSTCKITYAKRLSRRTFNEENKTTEWIPSDKVMLTFKGETLPDYIKVYGLINIKVHPFIEPVRKCRKCIKCWSYGHSQLKYQRMARCGLCGHKEHGEKPCSEKVSSTVKRSTVHSALAVRSFNSTKRYRLTWLIIAWDRIRYRK